MSHKNGHGSHGGRGVRYNQTVIVIFVLAIVSFGTISMLSTRMLASTPQEENANLGDPDTALKEDAPVQPILELNRLRKETTEPVARENLNDDVIIPRIIHQSWKNTDHIPERFEPWMQSWVDKHPGWTYVFWTDDENMALFQHLYPKYLYIAKNLNKIELADMARYAILHHMGGLYADADFECTKPFVDLHREYELFLSSEPLVHAVLLENSDKPALCNALMASKPGHPFWLHVMDSIKFKFDSDPTSHDTVGLTGPRIVKHTYEAEFSDDRSVTVLDPEYFYPEVAYWNLDNLRGKCKSRHDAAAVKVCNWLERFPKGEFTEKTHATHHWQCTWCRGEGGNGYRTLGTIFSSTLLSRTTKTRIVRPLIQAGPEPGQGTVAFTPYTETIAT